MPAEELADEITAGVNFSGYEIPRVGLVGVMGVQFVEDVALIRHAYVVPEHQRSGIGSSLLTWQCVRTWTVLSWLVPGLTLNGRSLFTNSMGSNQYRCRKNQHY